MSVPNGSVRRFAAEQNVPRRTFGWWLERADEYLSASFSRNQKHLSNREKDVVFPFGAGLLTFMMDVRREEEILTTAKMATWISTYHSEWLETYVSNSNAKYDDYNLSEILNVDETAIYYDMPPRRTWAEVGESSKVNEAQKHSDRITAVLTIRADGIV
ncbi:hypothetical protein ACHHYP_20554 [Achlya hypogyna]|uniref:Uncharacterized protein n=1 Tax=Achlya hypogyna TaxID=1202772 RepID=A0A1V9YJ02_ACHHY|nr:hypothetical protein ACHHYP_20554 [Achlya hypogyna]